MHNHLYIRNIPKTLTSHEYYPQFNIDHVIILLSQHIKHIHTLNHHQNSSLNNINQYKNYSFYSSFSIINSTNTIHHFKGISKEIIVTKEIVNSHTYNSHFIIFTNINIID